MVVGAAGSWALWKCKCGTNLLPLCSAEEGKASVLQQSRWNDQVGVWLDAGGCLFVIAGPVGRTGHLKTEPMHF